MNAGAGIKLFLIFCFGMAPSFLFGALVISNCEKKGGVYVGTACMKKDAVIK